MRLLRQPRQPRDRVGDDLVDRLLVVDDAVDEGRVGAVFEQPPHQIGAAGPRGCRPAHRRGTAGPACPARRSRRRAPRPCRADAEIPSRGGRRPFPGRPRRYARCGSRIADRRPSPRVEQPPRAGEIGDIGRDLAGIDRIAVEPALLGALDLAVPIGALDQPHHQPPAAAPRQVGEPVDHRRRPLLVGLHREAEPVPAGELRGERQRSRRGRATARGGRLPRHRS